LDVNLAMIKFTCRLLPSPYATDVEAAARGLIGVDKWLLFAEGYLAANGTLWVAGKLLKKLLGKKPVVA